MTLGHAVQLLPHFLVPLCILCVYGLGSDGTFDPINQMISDIPLPPKTGVNNAKNTCLMTQFLWS